VIQFKFLSYIFTLSKLLRGIWSDDQYSCKKNRKAFKFLPPGVLIFHVPILKKKFQVIVTHPNECSTLHEKRSWHAHNQASKHWIYSSNYKKSEKRQHKFTPIGLINLSDFMKKARSLVQKAIHPFQIGEVRQQFRSWALLCT